MKAPQLIVRRTSAKSTRGWVEFGPFRWRCALGRSGISSEKREGDGATPLGRHRLLYGYFRDGHFPRIKTALPLKSLKAWHGWCDSPSDGNYNREVCYPYKASAEALWRDDRLYDCIIVLDYNICPRVRGKGSAIFMHVARPGFLPTEGCIAMRKSDLRTLLTHLPSNASIIVP
jgi:L,D-peptidoglycan transpeptidase YkuD (ErfK/YbiS/YcfS/YnhG family)